MDAMTTVRTYLDTIHKGNWHTFIADSFRFGPNTVEHVGDRDLYFQGAGQFFSATTAVEIVQSVQNGNEIALITRYTTQSPDGRTGSLDVAEFITVENGLLAANAIFFDSEAFAAFMTGGQ